MTKRQVVDVNALLALNADFSAMVAKGDPWAMNHLALCESLNRGEHEGYRRPFDGQPRKWCGGACPFDEGCVTCTLPENPRMAQANRAWKARKEPEDLARSGIILIEGEVNEEMEIRVRRYLTLAAEARVEKLEVRITSNGGSSKSCTQIYHALREAPGVRERVGVVMSHALSAGLILLQACDRRIGARDARFLLHHIRYHEVTLPELRDPHAIQRMISYAEPDEDHGNSVLVARTGRSLEEVLAACDRDTQMTSSEALAFGLIDEIR